MTSETTRAELVADLLAMGVRGCHCMVHSSFKAIRPVEGGPQGVVDAFVEAVGDGVLLFPTFDFESWSEWGYWDRQHSPSRMGAISEAARKGERFIRTAHPMLSYALRDKYVGTWETVDATGRATGRRYPLMQTYSSSYMDASNNAHGIGSVFDRFVDNDGLLLSFSGEGFRPNDVGYTISNHCAVLADAPWRFMKVFEGTYVDNGVATIRKYSASVCRREKYATEVSPAHEAAEREGVIKRYKLGRTECLVASAREFVEWGVRAHRERAELWRREL